MRLHSERPHGEGLHGEKVDVELNGEKVDVAIVCLLSTWMVKKSAGAPLSPWLPPLFPLPPYHLILCLSYSSPMPLLLIPWRCARSTRARLARARLACQAVGGT